jgi:Tol biopolymer transport system component
MRNSIALAVLASAAILFAFACSSEGQPGVHATGKIAFVSDREGRRAIHLMDADGSGQTFLTGPIRTQVTDPSWSLDGTRLAFVRDDNIYAMNADGSGYTRLSDDDIDDYDQSPAWSPDGTRIAFASWQRAFGGERRNDSDIYVMNADGSNIGRLTDDPSTDLLPAWSPDGSRIAFISNRNQRWDLYVMNADGSNQTLLVESVDHNSAAAWSPDGERLAFAGSPGSHIYVMDIGDSKVSPLTEKPGMNFSPAWSPDGRHIAFVSNRDRNLEIYLMNADGSGQRRLTDNPAEDTDPAWLPAP